MNGSKGIGYARLTGGIVLVIVRAEGPGIIGHYSERLTLAEFRAAGWVLKTPLRQGESSVVLPMSDSEPAPI